MRRFYFYARKSSGIYFAELIDPSTGRRLPARSTRTRDREEALLVVGDWLSTGLPSPDGKRRPLSEAAAIEALLAAARETSLLPEDASRVVGILRDRGLIEVSAVPKGPGSEVFIDFLLRFWTYGKSPYIAEKLAHGQQIGKRHAYEMVGRVRCHWMDAFKGKLLAEIKKADLKAFSLSLAEKGLSPSSINKILFAGTVALRWAHDNELIPSDPSEGLVKFSGAHMKRGVLGPEEAARLFALPWIDERARIGNLTAATTGLRAGEILGLRMEDIGEAFLFVRHSWSEIDGLKSTKTNEERRVPLLPQVQAELLNLAAKNPHGDGFVFYGAVPGRPMGSYVLLDGLKEALLGLTLEGDDLKNGKKRDEARKAWETRYVGVHSWRHFYASRLADKLDARKVMRSTGHHSSAVFEVYADHALMGDLAEVGEVAASTFGELFAVSNNAGG